MSHPRRLPPAPELLELVRQHGNMTAAAVALGCHSTAVKIRLRKDGVHSGIPVGRPRVLPPIDALRREVIELGSQTAVAAKYGVTPEAVSRALKRAEKAGA